MRFVVVGCGRVGAGLARTLALREHDVTVIDSDPDAFARLGAETARARIEMVCGIGFDRDVLVAAGIDRADGLAAVTGSDAVNVVVARSARLVFHIPRVVARLYDPLKAEIYRRLGIHTIAQVSWGVNRLADVLVYSGLGTLMSIGGGEVELVEVDVPPLLAGRPLSSLQIAGEVQVSALRRKEQTFLPAEGTLFAEGDVAYLMVRARSADRLRKMLQVG